MLKLYTRISLPRLPGSNQRERQYMILTAARKSCNATSFSLKSFIELVRQGAGISVIF
jgi:hypothetical protein